ncbi:MAG: electron transfer flavoprotein subunit alpha/FixB family protein [Desulfobacterales bacterium]|nr:electron transfer flavoprotein subunit alpha/FixB family protein [Desulfobacterales bacterium]MDD4072437.1 electron transfer flavoprotein subunit alpha/FixB family protein [Desulfobacterales bacterium]MDD4392733.1 electron transfer flavoprotein subunit alpha/FixB family protein [Desulfobacterales bacterium]
MTKDIWIISENNESEITDLTKELLGIGKTLKGKTGGKVCAVTFGKYQKPIMDQLAEYGAECIYWVKDTNLSNYNSELYLNNLEYLLKNNPPKLLLVGMTYNGREVASLLSARLMIYFIPGCIFAKVLDSHHVEAARWICNGEAQEQTVVETENTLILGFPPDTRGIEALDGSTKPEIISVESVCRNDARITHLNFIASNYHEIDLTEADIVISGGNGAGDSRTYEQLWELGELMEVPVGGSRMAQDKGWISSDRMVGASGKILRSSLYLAFGISGAIQHVMGIKDCKKIVAVNTDSNADIMKIADLAAVGDVHKILPDLIRKLRERKELHKKQG